MSGQPAQTKTIRSQLLADMKDGAYASCERLPRESVLAEKLGISRTPVSYTHLTLPTNREV